MIQALVKFSYMQHIYITFAGIVTMLQVDHLIKDAGSFASFLESSGVIGMLSLISYLLWKEKKELTSKLVEMHNNEVKQLQEKLDKRESEIQKLLQLLLDEKK